MTTKTAILASIGILVGALALGLALLFLFIDPGAARANDRAAMIGQGVGSLCLVPLGVVWISWAIRIRKERELQGK